MGELTVGLTAYFAYNNGERPHQSLDDQTPQTVYRTGIGGGAMIVDKFGGAGGGTNPRKLAPKHNFRARLRRSHLSCIMAV